MDTFFAMQSHRPHRLTRRALTALWGSVLFLSAPTAQAQAQPQSQPQPIQIQADQLVSQDQAGQSVYSGQVTIEQGQTQVSGQKATLFHPERRLSQTQVTGQPAKFKHFLPEKKQWIQGQALQITHDVINQTLRLQGEAWIQQGPDNTIQGADIFYDLKTKRLKAQGDDTQQLEVTFEPQSQASEE